MARRTINKQEHTRPTRKQFLQEPNEVTLFLALRKRVNKGALAARRKNIGVLVLEVHYCDGFASLVRPALRYARDEAERGFVFAGHDKTLFAVVSGETPRFFLNFACSSSVAAL